MNKDIKELNKMVEKCVNCGHEVKDCQGEGLMHYGYDDETEVHLFSINCFGEETEECDCSKPKKRVKCEDE